MAWALVPGWPRFGGARTTEEPVWFENAARKARRSRGENAVRFLLSINTSVKAMIALRSEVLR